MRILYAAALTLVAIGFFAIVGLTIAWWPEPSEFSVKHWQRTTHEKRETMAEDFIANYYYEGMTVDEVKKLLGPSDFMPDYEDEYLSYLVSKMVIDDIVLWIPVLKDGTTTKPYISIHGS